MSEYRERRIRAQDGLRLYVRDYGDPLAEVPAALCLAGLTRNSKDFHELALRLAETRRVLCPDFRGRGRSAYDPDWRNYEPRTYVADALDVLAACGVHRMVVIGTSLGGLLAMGLAVAAPARLAAVVLNDIGPDVEPAGLARIVDYIARDRPQPDWEAASEMLRRTFPTLSRRDPDIWAKLARNTFREGEDGRLHFDWDVALAKAVRSPRTPPPPLWPLFGALSRVPTLAVRGAISEILSAEGLARMEAAKPDLRTVTVPDTGHAPTLCEPEAFAPLLAFLAEAAP